MKKQMRLLLTPRHHEAYGQDFLVRGMVEACGLTRITPQSNSTYDIPETTSLVVSQNVNEQADSVCLCNLNSNIPVIAHLHCQWDYFDEGQKQLITSAMHNTSVGIVPADFLTREASELFPHVKWRTVHNGVDTNRFYPVKNREKSAFKKKYHIPEKGLLIGYVGRLEDAKGFQVLEYLARHLDEIGAYLFIQFLSTTENTTTNRYKALAEHLESINNNRVRIFADKNPLSDRPVKYFDRFLLSSLSEVNPLVVLEALLSGVPVISTNSTPFFDELENMNFTPDQFTRIDLPKRFKEFKLTREQLILETDEVSIVGSHICDLINQSKPIDDILRYSLAELALEAGFSSQSMYSEFNKIYNGATH